MNWVGLRGGPRLIGGPGVAWGLNLELITDVVDAAEMTDWIELEGTIPGIG